MPTFPADRYDPNDSTAENMRHPAFREGWIIGTLQADLELLKEIENGLKGGGRFERLRSSIGLRIDWLTTTLALVEAARRPVDAAPVCDCQCPEPSSGVALISMDCPIHNLRPSGTREA